MLRFRENTSTLCPPVRDVKYHEVPMHGRYVSLCPHAWALCLTMYSYMTPSTMCSYTVPHKNTLYTFQIHSIHIKNTQYTYLKEKTRSIDRPVVHLDVKTTYIYI